jgi:hypothetical protein
MLMTPIKAFLTFYYLPSLAHSGDSLNTGILLMTHLKIHISAKMTVNVTTNSIQEGT